MMGGLTPTLSYDTDYIASPAQTENIGRSWSDYFTESNVQRAIVAAVGSGAHAITVALTRSNAAGSIVGIAAGWATNEVYNYYEERFDNTVGQSVANGSGPGSMLRPVSISDRNMPSIGYDPAQNDARDYYINISVGGINIRANTLTCGVTYTANDGNNRVQGCRIANDTIYLHGGDDRGYGFGGTDRIYGLDGNDFLNGGDGDDFLFGGKGGDTYVLRRGQAGDVDHVYDTEGQGGDVARLGRDVSAVFHGFDFRDSIDIDGTFDVTRVVAHDYSRSLDMTFLKAVDVVTSFGQHVTLTDFSDSATMMYVEGRVTEAKVHAQLDDVLFI